MTFAHPETLYLLWTAPAVVLFVVWAFRSRLRTLAKLGPLWLERSAPRVHLVRAILVTITLALGVVALAQPRWGYRWQEVKRQGLAIVVVLDVSLSMVAEDVSPTRMERARREVIDLTEQLGGDRVGLVLFAGGAYPRMPLTLDYAALREIVRDSNAATLRATGSDLGAALMQAGGLLQDAVDSDRAILLLTDGEDHVGKARETAAILADQDIHIYALGIGTEDGAPIPNPEGGFKRSQDGELVLSRLDEELLKDIAQIGHGAYARSSAGNADLMAIYQQEIRGKLQSAEQGSRREKIWDERYQLPLALALVMALSACLIPARQAPVALLALILIAGPARAQTNSDVDALTRAYVENPQDADAAERLGQALFTAGDFERANRILLGAAQHSDDPDQQDRAEYNAGLAAYQSGRLTDAIAHWQSLTTRNADHAPGAQNLAAAQKELELRMQQQEEEQEQQEGDEGEDGEEQEDSEQQDSEQDSEQDGEQQDSDESEDSEPQEGEREPGEEEDREAVDTGQAEPADGSPTTGEEDTDGPPPRPGSLSSQEADRMLEGVEEGTPRVVIDPGSRGGPDW